LRAICAGYFVNLCSINSKTSDAAGFSHLRPPNRIGGLDEQDKTVDKALFLDRSTTIFLQGEHLRSELVIFTHVFCTRRTFINVVSRVKEQWIAEEAPKSWKEVVPWKHSMRCYLQEGNHPHVGPAIYDMIKSEIPQMERDSGCIIKGDKRRGILHFWGTTEEVALARNVVKDAIAEKRNHLLAQVREGVEIAPRTKVNVKAGAVVCNTDLTPSLQIHPSSTRKIMCRFSSNVEEQEVTTYLESFGTLQRNPSFLQEQQKTLQKQRLAAPLTTCFAVYTRVETAAAAVSSLHRPSWCFDLCYDRAIFWKLADREIDVYENKLEDLRVHLINRTGAKITIKPRHIKIVLPNQLHSSEILQSLGGFFGNTCLAVDGAYIPKQELLQIERETNTRIIPEGIRIRILGLKTARLRCKEILGACISKYKTEMVEIELPLHRGGARKIIGRNLPKSHRATK